MKSASWGGTTTKPYLTIIEKSTHIEGRSGYTIVTKLLGLPEEVDQRKGIAQQPGGRKGPCWSLIIAVEGGGKEGGGKDEYSRGREVVTRIFRTSGRGVLRLQLQGA